MPHLPEANGRYPVGATTFVRPIRPSFSVGASKFHKPTSTAGHSHLRNSAVSAEDNLEPTLVLEEVAFTAFYPTEISHGGGWLGGKVSKHTKGVDWVNKPVEETIKGYEHFGGQSYPGWIGSLLRPIISLLGSTIKIPAYNNAPLRAPSPGDAPQWPLVVFSHGLGGARTTYSHLCTRLAAEGRVVLALEHRDGTGPAVFPRGADGTRKSMYYVNPDAVVWPDGPGPDDAGTGKGKSNTDQALRLRVDQLEFRRREIYAVVEAFRGMVGGAQDRGGLDAMDGKDIDWPSWAGKVNFGTLDLVGHSFGGATLFSILSNTPPPMPLSQQLYPVLPIRRVLALDPWMEPLASPGPKPQDGAAAPELLVINSEAFTLWNSHFSTLQTTVRAFPPARLVTLARAQHISFSDFPLVTPSRFQAVDPVRMLGVVNTLAQAFLGGLVKLGEGELGVEGVKTREMEVILEQDGKGKEKRRLVGEEGDVILH